MTTRYQVYEVRGDGVPCDTGAYAALADALEERDRRRREQHERYGRAFHFHCGVFDRDDPERGDLDRDDLPVALIRFSEGAVSDRVTVVFSEADYRESGGSISWNTARLHGFASYTEAREFADARASEVLVRCRNCGGAVGDSPGERTYGACLDCAEASALNASERVPPPPEHPHEDRLALEHEERLRRDPAYRRECAEADREVEPPVDDSAFGYTPGEDARDRRSRGARDGVL